jgi:hypothetical protein
MLIIAIGWVYVVFMISITEQSVMSGVLTFFMYAMLPLAVILYVMGKMRREPVTGLPEKTPDASLQVSTVQSEVIPDAPSVPENPPSLPKHP